MISRAAAGPIVAEGANANALGAGATAGADTASAGARSTGTRVNSTRPIPAATGNNPGAGARSSRVGDPERRTTAVGSQGSPSTVSQDQAPDSSIFPRFGPHVGATGGLSGWTGSWGQGQSMASQAFGSGSTGSPGSNASAQGWGGATPLGATSALSVQTPPATGGADGSTTMTGR